MDGGAAVHRVTHLSDAPEDVSGVGGDSVVGVR